MHKFLILSALMLSTPAAAQPRLPVSICRHDSVGIHMDVPHGQVRYEPVGEDHLRIYSEGYLQDNLIAQASTVVPLKPNVHAHRIEVTESDKPNPIIFNYDGHSFSEHINGQSGLRKIVPYVDWSSLLVEQWGRVRRDFRAHANLPWTYTTIQIPGKLARLHSDLRLWRPCRGPFECQRPADRERRDDRMPAAGWYMRVPSVVQIDMPRTLANIAQCATYAWVDPIAHSKSTLAGVDRAIREAAAREAQQLPDGVAPANPADLLPFDARPPTAAERTRVEDTLRALDAARQPLRNGEFDPTP